MAQSKNCPFGVGTTVEVKNTPRSGNNGIRGLRFDWEVCQYCRM